MTVSEYIFDFFAQKGCEKVFMVSGSSAMWLSDALARETRLKHICTHHEQAAAMAADALGRCTGLPGICLVTIGPGATNAITGVAGAFVDSSPLVVLSGQASSGLLQYEQDTQIRQQGTQSLNLQPIIQPITKYFAAVMQPEEIRYHVERAFWEATHGRPGPVWLDIPVDIQNRQVPEAMGGFVAPNAPEADISALGGVADLILQSKKPLILAGGGVRMSNATKELLELSAAQSIPVVTSRGGIDCIESVNPLFVGRPGAYGDRASHFAIQNCDLLLTLGSRFSVSTIGYYPQRFAQKATIVQIDIDQKELDKTGVPVDVSINADIKSALQFLLSAVKSGHSPSAHKTQWAEYCHALREKYPVVLPSYEKETPLNPYYFTKLLGEEAAAEQALVVDTGTVCNFVSQSWKLKKGQRYFISGGLSAMGFWAAAIGPAAQGIETIALSGDGSAQMNIQELATLHYNQLPVKWFIFQNKGYTLIRHNQHNYMNDRFIGVGADSGLETPDFCKVAAAYGVPSVRIEAGDTVVEQIRWVLAQKGPVVCEVMIQEFAALEPRIASKVMPDGSLKAAEFDDLFPFIEREECAL